MVDVVDVDVELVVDVVVVGGTVVVVVLVVVDVELVVEEVVVDVVVGAIVVVVDVVVEVDVDVDVEDVDDVVVVVVGGMYIAVPDKRQSSAFACPPSVQSRGFLVDVDVVVNGGSCATITSISQLSLIPE